MAAFRGTGRGHPAGRPFCPRSFEAAILRLLPGDTSLTGERRYTPPPRRPSWPAAAIHMTWQSSEIRRQRLRDAADEGTPSGCNHVECLRLLYGHIYLHIAGRYGLNMFVIDFEGELSLEVLEGTGEYICTVPVAEADGKVLSIFVAISVVPGNPELYELVFNTIVSYVWEKDAEDLVLWDGIPVRQFVPQRQHRRRLLDVVCACVETIVDQAKPDLLVMNTHTPDLPKQALSKFDLITKVIKGRGYETGRGNKFHGRHNWMMRRIQT